MYLAPKPGRWIGRIDHPEDKLTMRWHQVINYLDLSPEKAFAKNLTINKKQVTFLGFSCDEGVLRNNGRPGARNGPEAIRKQLTSLPFHWQNSVSLADGGDIICDNEELEKAQELLAETLNKALQTNQLPIVLGGGHEIAWGSFNGLFNYLKQGSETESPKIGIINFDAHFDLRDFKKTTSSGTPFAQIADLCQQENLPFLYLCLGIQKMGNTPRLFETANTLNVNYILAENFNLSNLNIVLDRLDQFIKQCDFLYVTIDLDGFQSSIAPGVSAPSALGFSPEIVIKCLEQIIYSGKTKLIDIAEMNPEFDIDNSTAKLSAALIFNIIDKLAEF